MKVCSKCKEEKPVEEFPIDKQKKDGFRPQCRTCFAESRLTHNQDKIKRWIRNKKYKLRIQYGLSLEEYDALVVAQNGVCKICKQLPSGRRHDLEPLCVDHKGSKVRGLLCYNCNLGLGHFKDNPDLLTEAILYLKESEIN